MSASVPAAVKRYVRRPLWWLLGVTVVALALFVSGVLYQRADRREAEGWVRVDATVADSYRGGQQVPIRYTHPVTGDEVTIDVERPDAPLEPGQAIQVLVSPDDPRHAGFDGASPELSAAAFYLWLPLAAVPSLVYARRRWNQWRVDGLTRRDSASYAMRGALGPPRRWGRVPMLSIYALDAAPGAPAMCSVPVLNTAGVPFGTTVTLEVKGAPRSYGRVVARCSGTVLWPSGRAASQAIPRPPALIEQPRQPSLTDARAANDRPWWRALWPELLATSGALFFLLIVTLVTINNQAAADELVRTGTRVVATLRDTHDFSLDVSFQMPDGRTIETSTPADYPEDFPLDLRFPAVVDPGDPTRVRLLTEPYDPIEPIGWAVIPLLIAATETVRRAASIVSVRRATRDQPTYRYDVRVANRGPRTAQLEIGYLDEPYPRCSVRVPANEVALLPLTTAVDVRGLAEPGAGIILTGPTPTGTYTPLAFARAPGSLDGLQPARPTVASADRSPLGTIRRLRAHFRHRVTPGTREGLRSDP